jgi:site-specific DNA recombinase
MDAIAVVRCSTTHQANEGNSLETQTKRITAYCEANGLTLVRIYEEAGVSGLTKLTQRNTLNEALDEVCRRKCALVVYSISRLSRSLTDSIAILERIQKAGAELVSLSERIDTTCASGKLVTNMLMLLQNFEVEQLRERVTVTMSCLRKSNKRISRYAPFGYDFAENMEDLVENPSEQAAIQQMKTLRASGRSFRQIAFALEHVPTKTGAKWSAPVIRGILHRQHKLSLAA